METAKNISYDHPSISKIIMDCILIFGPNLAFISQITKFRTSKSSEGFSKIICLLILLGNILRIFFWYGKRFDTPLLFQSIISIIMQFFLLHEYLKVSKDKNTLKAFISSSFTKLELDNKDDSKFSENHSLNINMEEYHITEEDDEEKNINNPNNNPSEEDSDLKANGLKTDNKSEIANKKWEQVNNPNQTLNKFDYSDLTKFFYDNGIEDLLNYKMFWNWPFISDYLFFCIFFSIIIAINFSVFGFHNKYLIEIIGYVSLIIESMIGIPQIIENYKNKSTKNLSFFMIFFWLTGDTLKTLYFLKFKAPMQFVICGFFQMIVDCSIIFQINYYNRFE